MFHSSKDMVRVPKSIDGNDEGKYYCDMCTSDGWYSETEVEIHKNNKHKKKMNDIFANEDNVCGLCCTQFKNELELLKHIKREHLYTSEDAYRIERDIFICDHCDQIFFNKVHLIAHIIKKYGNKTEKKKKIQCPHCDITIQCRHLWVHFQHHMLQSISSCRICMKKCKNRNVLKEHLKQHQKNFRCDICGYISKQSNLFISHIRSQHKQAHNVTGSKHVRRFFIPRSEKSVGQSQIVTVQKGIEVTNGIRICVLCREICSSYSEMKNHIYRDHVYKKTVVGAYNCSCGAVFTNKVLLKHHVFKLKGSHEIVSETQSS